MIPAARLAKANQAIQTDLTVMVIEVTSRRRGVLPIVGCVRSTVMFSAMEWRDATKRMQSMTKVIPAYFWQEDAAHSKLERIVWPKGPVCPHCKGTSRVGSVGKGARTALKICHNCRRQFRATIGTVFEHSHVPLHKWFQTIFLRYCCQSHVNPHNLHFLLQLSYKTAVRMVASLDDKIFRDLALYGECSSTESRFSKERRLMRRFRPDPGCIPCIQRPALWSLPRRNRPPELRAFLSLTRQLGPPADEELFDQVLLRIIGPIPQRPACAAG